MSAPALPYGFARTQGVLVIAHDQDSAEILLREGADVNVVSEVRRHIGVPLRVVGSIGRAGFETRLAEMYGQGENDAAEVVQDLGQDVDILKLMQELPSSMSMKAEDK